MAVVTLMGKGAEVAVRYCILTLKRLLEAILPTHFLPPALYDYNLQVVLGSRALTPSLMELLIRLCGHFQTTAATNKRIVAAAWMT